MRILYVASAIEVPASYGGATHVTEVAGGLARLGHTLHVVARRQRGLKYWQGDGYVVDRERLPQQAALVAYADIARIARAFRPDVIMERYYNFAGGGILYAHRHKIPALLEVNAAMLDPKDALKSRLDHTIFLNRLRWWAETQGKWAARIVTPLHTTVPPAVPRAKIVELPWGANVDMFDPAHISGEAVAELRNDLGIAADTQVVGFVGSFRRWHGVNDLITAATHLLAARPQVRLLLVGGGDAFEQIKADVAARGLTDRIIMTGALPYEDIPRYLRLCTLGVAPFNTQYHPALRESGFYWSPLKIFEYMAMRLPVVTADIAPLNAIVQSGITGALFREGDSHDLAAAIGRLLDLPDTELAAMGARARATVVEKYSWAVHCREVAAVLAQMVGEGAHGGD